MCDERPGRKKAACLLEQAAFAVSFVFLFHSLFRHLLSLLFQQAGVVDVGLHCYVVGPFFDFHVGLGNIVAHDAQAEELDASDKNDDADGGSPAGHRISEDQPPQDDKDQHEEGEARHEHAEPGGDIQGDLGKVGDAVDGIGRQLPEVPLGFSGDTLYIFMMRGEHHVCESVNKAFGNIRHVVIDVDGVRHKYDADALIALLEELEVRDD